jgi:NADH:ubiquinone oxidoreductase subunit 6 (subunit J)
MDSSKVVILLTAVVVLFLTSLIAVNLYTNKKNKTYKTINMSVVTVALVVLLLLFSIDTVLPN